MLNKYLNPTNIYINRNKFNFASIIITLFVLFFTFFIFSSIVAKNYKEQIKPMIEQVISSNEQIDTSLQCTYDAESRQLDCGIEEAKIFEGKDFKYAFNTEQTIPESIKDEEFVLFTPNGVLYNVDQKPFYFPFYSIFNNEKYDGIDIATDFNVVHTAVLDSINMMIENYEPLTGQKVMFSFSSGMTQYVQLVLLLALLTKITTFIMKTKLTWREIFNVATVALVLPSLVFLGAVFFGFEPSRITNIVLIISTFLVFFSIKNGLSQENSLK